MRQVLSNILSINFILFMKLLCYEVRLAIQVAGFNIGSSICAGRRLYRFYSPRLKQGGDMIKKVMVVDDSVSMRKVVAMVLSRVGHMVVESSDGAEALQKLRHEKVNLIICDVNMPNMDGISFLKNLRQQGGAASIPVVMLTTESQGRLRELGSEAGARAWILKPFQPEQLLDVVSSILD